MHQSTGCNATRDDVRVIRDKKIHKTIKKGILK